jgi:uncharacterized lipoprotein YddW (UPF0748 family)
MMIQRLCTPYIAILALCSFCSVSAISQEAPKREFRGAWVATVGNSDWPSSRSSTSEVQQNELRTLLDQLHALGITAVMFQVRTECDALYASSIEPWSYYLTGAQGQAPNPLYDPLEFAVREAHQRGMELHAWLNPYRAVRAVGSYALVPSHVSLLHPDWVITINTFKFLNPGLAKVREYVAGVVADIVRRYDVDGIHFDDYFYPYPPDAITNQDDQTFAVYPRGFSNRGDWRRDNVNLLVEKVHDSIQTLKPWVKFGISPFGIWRNGVPPGISGLDAYSQLYCDAMAWLRGRSVDYLTPQLYWAIGGAQDYGKLMPWWADSAEAYGRHLYTGHAAYKIVSSTNLWSATELPAQIVLNRGNPKTDGSVFYRAKSGLIDNPKGFADSLMQHYYRYSALSPVMAWHDTVAPYMPRGIRYGVMNGIGPAALFWDLPLTAPDGDSAWMYAVYSFDHNPTLPAELDDARNLMVVGQQRTSTPPVPASGPRYYLVTALDRSGNESLWSSVISVSAPSVPLLIAPAHGAPASTDTVVFLWHASPLTSRYTLQVSTDSAFAGTLFICDSSVTDTFRVVRGLTGQSLYYWRVRAENAGGAGVFSPPNRLRADFPLSSRLAYPPNYAVNMPLTLTFRWRPSAAATSYRLQI